MTEEDSTLNFGSITLLLEKAQAGDGVAMDDLFDRFSQALRGTAEGLMKRERPDHTLSPSALINETCAELLRSGILETAKNRRYFYGAANQAMQRILIDHARNKNAKKRKGRERIPLERVLHAVEESAAASIIDLNAALKILGEEDARLREVVELRFFSGLSVEETAKILEVHQRTVHRDWRLARARLQQLLE